MLCCGPRASAEDGFFGSMFGSDPAIASGKSTGRFTSFDCMKGLLESGDVALLKGSWLIQQFKAGMPLPRRQDVDVSTATWDGGTVFDEVTAGRVGLIVVSHAWLSAEHPDPMGQHLKTLVRVLEVSMFDDHAIFLDWCSLHQEPRSDAEAKSYENALNNIDVWYAHQASRVWFLNTVPDGSERNTPYDDRGWPYFERQLSEIGTTQRNFLLDLSKLDAVPKDKKHPEKDWATICAICAVQRRVPLAAGQFQRELGRKLFTVAADSAVLAQRHTAAFVEALVCAEHLSWVKQDWGAEEVVKLKDLLPKCKNVQKIDLSENNFTDVDAEKLIDICAGLPALQELCFKQNKITDKDKLKTRWGKGKDPDLLKL